ncbi:MAG: hypothetical protein GKR89_15300 [Candidatus Latescibacteria bacterium]|nr:hypothetical protein [Candidatus Latescibacterota bacterium]
MQAPELFADGFAQPSGMALDVDDQFFVAETGTGRIHKIATDGIRAPFAETGGRPAGIAFDDSSDLIVAEEGRHDLLIVSFDGSFEIYAHQCRGKRFTGPRELCFSPNSDILFTDSGGTQEARGGIYRVDIDGDVVQMASGLACPTGLVVAEDGSSLFVAETDRNRILVYEMDDQDKLENQQVFVEFDEGNGPLALAFDSEGTLFVARPGVGLTQVDLDGKIIDAPFLSGTRPNGLLFGGTEYDELYISETDSGSIYRMHTDHPGQRPFAGPRGI